MESKNEYFSIAQYDLRRLPPQLQPLSFLVGKWRSEHGGKAIFPTIPKFTYGEEVDISIPDDALQAQRALNYSDGAEDDFNHKYHILLFLTFSVVFKVLRAEHSRAFAWSVNEKDELHSEAGYISVKPNTRDAALTTVMNNGFVTVEEGPIKGNSIKFRLKDVGRISFSRDLPVHDMVREWTLLDKNTLQARLNMETLTHGMQEHTFIRYHKIAP
ncbi:hypothetical protein ANCDUO_03386 [Ancylostoma duodenale]|uniref:THAP4-like heme-binding domain-containing protein n=1 Tax=Ancylostoma duodenale TaxID=51022 RepID=A0A0C2H9U4_9BILA|nr:hypothetical protein ANCDUO_03386 [Ancylostoma duodenale]